MIRSVLTQETVYELQPVKDCHDKIKLKESPESSGVERILWWHRLRNSYLITSHTSLHVYHRYKTVQSR